MAGNRLEFLSTVFVIYFCLGIDSSKLNVPRVLLPIFNSISLNFTLEATEGGCYKWSTSRSDVIQLTLIESVPKYQCSSKAIVFVVTKEHVRNTAIVLAEEVHSGQVLRCDVITDSIASLSILTTTRELFMEEAPEAFEVRAYDAQGNEFTTLEGVEFHWTLGSWNNLEGPHVTNVLRFITFAESPYETPPSVKVLDSLGLHGHMVLLEGLKTGTAKVSVQLPYREYIHIPAMEVHLTVMSNLLIDPSDVHVLQGDTVQYRILQVQQGHLDTIRLPSPQYFLEVVNTTVATIDSKTAITRTLNPGKTKIILHDRNMNENESGIKLPTATLAVRKPAYLTLTILPHRNWAVVVGEHYEIVVEVFDRDDHKFHIGDKVEISTLIPEEYFQVIDSSSNGSYSFGVPIQTGSAQVKSTLMSVVDPDGKIHSFSPRISTQANLLIYDKINLHPAEVILPWDPNSRPKYEIDLKASGGDRNYVWSSADISLAVVSQSGVVHTKSHGYVEILAAMTSNVNNFGVSRFYIVPPLGLEIVEYVLEAEVGYPIFLHIAMFTTRIIVQDETNASSDMVPFTQCDGLPFQVTIIDDNFIYNESLHTSPVGISCTALAIVPIAIGTAKVTVSYVTENEVLSDSVTVASYRPLKPIYPSSGETVLAVGSSVHIAFIGGPRPWIGRTSEHTVNVEYGKEYSVIDVETIDSFHEQQDMFVYRILCKQIGESEVVVTVTNSPIVKHCKHSVCSASVRVICAKPRYLYLEPHIAVFEEKICPISFNPERIVAQNYRDVEINLIVKDEHGRKFDNITSLNIDWWLSDEDLLSVSRPESSLAETKEENGIIIPVRHYQVLQPKMKSGVLDIVAKVVGYQTKLLRQLEIISEYPSFGVLDDKGVEVTPDISSALSMILVNDTIITPNQTSVFNHPNNRVVLHVDQGSGYYDFVLSSEDVADVIYKEGTREIEIIPKADGLLKIALVDLCLSSKPAMAEVQVLGVGSIKVDVPEKVEKGRCVSAVVRLYDAMDNILPVPDPNLLDLRPLLETGLISVKMQYDKDVLSKASLAGEVHFVVTGLELGDKRLTFAAGHGSREVRSQPVPIQVFPPLRLLPRNVTLVMGSVFQISCHGGPQPDPNIEYSLAGPIAKVNKKGIVCGLSIGETVLIGRAVGLNKVNSQKVVYAQDSIHLKVVPLEGIRIEAPLVRIRTGATMPVYVNGIPAQLSPLIIGSTNSVRFSWSLSSSDFATLNNVYHETKMTVLESDLLSMRFTGIKPGRTTIYLTVTVPGAMTLSQDEEEVKFHSSMDVEVFEVLRLVNPSSAGEIQSPLILMAPNSECQLELNQVGPLEFSVMQNVFPTTTHTDFVGESDTLSLTVGNTNPIVSVDENGLVKSFSSLGSNVLVVSVKEEFGLKQILGITIEVKPVHYLMINMHVGFHVMEGETVSVLPLGAENVFSVSYHDHQGKIFTAAKSEIKLRINRFDLTKLGKGKGKNSMVAHLMHSGSTVLKVWDDLTLQHCADYIRLTAGRVITPQVSTITVGDIVCFSMPLVSTTDKIGSWTSDNADVMHMSATLGIGRARSPGNVVVRHHLSETTTNTEIKVLPVHKVKILSTKQNYITNSDPDAVFKVPIVLRSEIEKNKIGNMISVNGTCQHSYILAAYPYYCSLQFTNPDVAYDIDDVFAVHQDFDFRTGEYSCNIHASGEPPPGFSILQTNVSLTVDSGGILSTPLIILFFPAVYVSTPEIHLSDAHMTGTLIISGIPSVLDKIEVIPGDTLMTISKPDVSSVANAYSFQVRLSAQYWKIGELSHRMNVSVISRLTSQVIQVPVKVHLGGENIIHSPCLVSHVSGWGSYIYDFILAYQNTLYVVCFITICLAVIVYVYIQHFVQSGQITRSQSIVLPSQFFHTNLISNISQSSVGTPSPTTFIARQPIADCQPVYGDPRFYSGKPELRHLKRTP